MPHLISTIFSTDSLLNVTGMFGRRKPSFNSTEVAFLTDQPTL